MQDDPSTQRWLAALRDGSPLEKAEVRRGLAGPPSSSSSAACTPKRLTCCSQTSTTAFATPRCSAPSQGCTGPGRRVQRGDGRTRGLSPERSIGVAEAATSAEPAAATTVVIVSAAAATIAWATARPPVRAAISGSCAERRAPTTRSDHSRSRSRSVPPPRPLVGHRSSAGVPAREPAPLFMSGTVAPRRRFRGVRHADRRAGHRGAVPPCGRRVSAVGGSPGVGRSGPTR